MNSLSRNCRLLLAKSRSSTPPGGLSTFKFSSFSPSPLTAKPFKEVIVKNQGFQYSLGTQRQFSSDAAPKLSKEHFDKLVKNNKVVVFMKGVPDEPRCGFSNAIVQVLRMHGVTSYDSHDVLQNESIRQGIKEYTSWPTIPQVFINGEFVGGCDIVIEMHKNGELVEQLSKAGIKSALLDETKKKDS